MKKKLIITLVMIVFLWVVFFTTDSIRAKNNKGPIFAIYHDTIKDDGLNTILDYFIMSMISTISILKQMMIGIIKMA